MTATEQFKILIDAKDASLKSKMAETIRSVDSLTRAEVGGYLLNKALMRAA